MVDIYVLVDAAFLALLVILTFLHWLEVDVGSIIFTVLSTYLVVLDIKFNKLRERQKKLEALLGEKVSRRGKGPPR